MPWLDLQAEVAGMFRRLSRREDEVRDVLARRRGRRRDARMETQAKRRRDRELTREIRRQRLSYPRWRPDPPTARPDLEARRARHQEWWRGRRQVQL